MPSQGSVPGGTRSTALADRPEPQALEIRLRDRDGWSVITISGELDIQGVPLLRQLLVQAGHRIVLDLRGITFVDCGGLRLIVGRAPDPTNGVRRIVCEENGRVRRLLKLTGWEKTVSPYSSLDDALRDLT
ncbi:MAG: anti-sigma factor antagonist [Nocardioides sp.]